MFTGNICQHPLSLPSPASTFFSSSLLTMASILVFKDLDLESSGKGVSTVRSKVSIKGKACSQFLQKCNKNVVEKNYAHPAAALCNTNFQMPAPTLTETTF